MLDSARYGALIPPDGARTYPRRPSPSVKKGGYSPYPPASYTNAQAAVTLLVDTDITRTIS